MPVCPLLRCSISRGPSGGALTELFTAETTLENESTDIGFGVGEKAEYRFDEVRLSSPSLSAEEPSKLTEYIYDALGRRVAMTDYVGASAYTTRYLYAGNRIIEELDGDNNLRASYVYGQYAEGLAGGGWTKHYPTRSPSGLTRASPPRSIEVKQLAEESPFLSLAIVALVATAIKGVIGVVLVGAGVALIGGLGRRIVRGARRCGGRARGCRTLDDLVQLTPVEPRATAPRSF